MIAVFSIYIIIMNYLFIFCLFFIFTYLFIYLLKKCMRLHFSFFFSKNCMNWYSNFLIDGYELFYFNWVWVVISHFWALFVLHGPRVFLGWKSWKLYKKGTEALGNREDNQREKRCCYFILFVRVCVWFLSFLIVYCWWERIFPYYVSTIGQFICFFILYSYVGVAFGSESLDRFRVAFK